MNVGELLGKTGNWLSGQGSGSGRLDAELLLAEVLQLPRIQLYSSFDRPVARAEMDSYRELVRRRGALEPVAYILGSREFYSRDFKVDPRVLIPRPDTEVLVDTALDLLGDTCEDAIVLDYGTGSGAIAVTLAAERPGLKLLALDNSRDALDMARDNCRAHGVEGRVGLVLSEGLTRLPERFVGTLSAIVANPPYIAAEERERMARDVLDYEPAAALFPGDDPLLHYRSLANDGPRWLKDGGVLALEVGHTQAPQVCALLEAAGWRDVQVRSDLARVDRVVSARRG